MSIFSNVSRASSSWPARASASTHQNVQMENVPSSPSSPSAAAQLRVVAVDERVGDELLADRVERDEHARVGRGDEPHQRHQQRRGVELVAVEHLHERLALRRTSRASMICLEDLVAHLEPLHERRRQAALAGHAGGALEGDPAHQPRVRELLLAAAHLPDALVLLAASGRRATPAGRARPSTGRTRWARRTCRRGTPSRSARRRCRAAAARPRRCRCAPAASRGSPPSGRAAPRRGAMRPSMPYMIWIGAGLVDVAPPARGRGGSA